MLKIGVSACFMYPDPNRVVFGHKSLTYLENDMAHFLTTDETRPILIPDVKPEYQKYYLEQMDGLVLQGGVDVSPLTYGEEGIENNRWPGDKHRDNYELKLIDYAVKNKKPILGICRGAQILNCYFNGTLYQDLNLQTKTNIEHRCAEKYDKVKHTIEIEPKSTLHEVYGKSQIAINSVHHQGIKKLGDGLIPEAYCSEDNLIEAYRHQGEVFIWGVQWHPEFSHALGDQIASEKPIIKKFIEEIKKAKGYK